MPLWLPSPAEPDEDLLLAVEALRPVRVPIAPSTLDHWQAPAWKAPCPDAAVHAVPGLPQRAKRPLAVDVTRELRRASRWLL